MIFSIIITSYNYEKYIRDAVESALNQDFSGEYEVIVVDDCSTDSTPTILSDYSSLVRVNNSNNLGLEASVNRGIEIAKGRYVVRLDADDCLRENFLSVMCKYANSEDEFYYSNYTSIFEGGSSPSEVDLPKFNKREVLSRGDFLAIGTVFPRKMLLSVGSYSVETKNCGLENYELILKIIQKGYVGKLIDENLFFYRRHSNNLSTKKINRILNYGFCLAKQYGLSEYTINQYHPYFSSSDAKTNGVKYVPYKNGDC